MKAFCLFKGIILFIILAFSLSPKSQQADEKTTTQEPESSTKEPIKLPFISAALDLAKDLDPDNLEWIDVEEQQHLVFKQPNSGRVLRGNVILFHAQRENPMHARLIYPLSVQLSKIGWNTLSPNIAFPDFPTEKEFSKPPAQDLATKENELEQNTSSQSDLSSPPEVNDKTAKPYSKEIKTQRYFETPERFQAYFSLICQESIKLVTIGKEPTIILADQDAAYWVLDCISKMPPQTPFVLIQPKMPSFAQQDIGSTLKALSNPIFTFTTQNNDDYFVKLINQQKRQSPIHRYNQSALLNSKINMENTNVAKLITGWIKTINSQSQ